jgi:hypothetical protein
LFLEVGVTDWTVRIARVFCMLLGHVYETHPDGWSECARCTRPNPRQQGSPGDADRLDDAA